MDLFDMDLKWTIVFQFIPTILALMLPFLQMHGIYMVLEHTLLRETFTTMLTFMAFYFQMNHLNMPF